MFEVYEDWITCCFVTDLLILLHRFQVDVLDLMNMYFARKKKPFNDTLDITMKC